MNGLPGPYIKFFLRELGHEGKSQPPPSCPTRENENAENESHIRYIYRDWTRSDVLGNVPSCARDGRRTIMTTTTTTARDG